MERKTERKLSYIHSCVIEKLMLLVRISDIKALMCLYLTLGNTLQDCLLYL